MIERRRPGGSRRWWRLAPTLLLLALVALHAPGCGAGEEAMGPSQEEPGDDPDGPDTPPPSEARTVEVTPAADTLLALDATTQLGAVARDSAGNALSGVTVAWSSSASSVAQVDSSGRVTAVGNGEATITATVDQATGTATILVAQRVSAVQVTPSSASLGGPGETVDFTAQAVDANDNPILEPVLWISSSPDVATVDSTGLATARASGATTITAAVQGVPGYAVLSVSIPPPSRLAFQRGPGNISAGSPFDPALEIAVHDDAGSVVPLDGTEVSLGLSSNPGGGSLLGSVTAVTVDGIARFPGVTLDRAAGGYTLTASASGLADATSTSFDVTAGTATDLAFTLQPADAEAGTAFSARVAVSDSFGNPVTGLPDPVNVRIGANPGNGTLDGTLSATPVGGEAAFDDLSIERAATGYTLRASASGLDRVDSDGFDILPGPAARLAFTAPIPEARRNMAMAGVEVEVLDAFGNRSSGASTAITLALVEAPRGGSLSGTLTRTAVAGLASFNDLAIDSAGRNYRLETTAAGTTPDTSTLFTVRVDVRRLTGGNEHTCGPSVRAGFCWGFNDVGRLGDGTNLDSNVPSRVAGNLSFRTIDTSAEALISCGATLDETAHCWGAGILGDGAGSQISDVPVAVFLPIGVTAATVATGSDHACLLTSTTAGVGAGQAYCWGANNEGQIGDNSTIDATFPTAVSGGLTWSMLSGGDRSNVRLDHVWGGVLLGAQQPRNTAPHAHRDGRRPHLHLDLHGRRSDVRRGDRRGCVLLGGQRQRPRGRIDDQQSEPRARRRRSRLPRGRRGRHPRMWGDHRRGHLLLG